MYYLFWSIANFPYPKPNRSIDTPSMSASFCVCVVQCGQKPIIRPRNFDNVYIWGFPCLFRQGLRTFTYPQKEVTSVDCLLTVSQSRSIAASLKKVFDMRNSSSAKQPIVFSQYLKGGALLFGDKFCNICGR
jgi:hypothetical protein